LDFILKKKKLGCGWAYTEFKITRTGFRSQNVTDCSSLTCDALGGSSVECRVVGQPHQGWANCGFFQSESSPHPQNFENHQSDAILIRPRKTMHFYFPSWGKSNPKPKPKA